MGKMTEEDRLMRRINQRFMKGVMNYKLIEEGDRILVGLSGGKDSLALLELLAQRSRIYKPKFSVVAAHVVMKNIAYESDQTYLLEYAESLGVPTCVMKRNSIRRPIHGSRHAFSAHGIVVRLFSLWPKSRDATKSLWDITWTTYWKPC